MKRAAHPASLIPHRLSLILALFLFSAGCWPSACSAANWPRWRGPAGNAIADGADLPVHWDTKRNVLWSVPISGEGASSPVIWEDRVFITSALEGGSRRLVHCLQLETGKTLWTREIEDDYPEITSALTGHAAATPVTDGKRVIAFFGNAGVVCYDFEGRKLWQRGLGQFVTELGLASSPVLYDGRVILVCDHDGNRFKTFHSYLIALDAQTGKTVWKTDRRGLYRSWSTPILVPVPDGPAELIVNAQDELRAYDPKAGRALWSVAGMTGWVTPSPVFAGGLIYATSGKNGPTMAVRPGGLGDVTETRVVWSHPRGAPYVCSPLLYRDLLYVHDELGILTCFRARDGELMYRQRLGGKFTASGIAADGRIYVTNDEGVTYVIRAGEEFRLLAKNPLGEECLASPAACDGKLLIRTQHRLYCLVGEPQPKPADSQNSPPDS